MKKGESQLCASSKWHMYLTRASANLAMRLPHFRLFIASTFPCNPRRLVRVVDVEAFYYSIPKIALLRKPLCLLWSGPSFRAHFYLYYSCIALLFYGFRGEIILISSHRCSSFGLALYPSRVNATLQPFKFLVTSFWSPNHSLLSRLCRCSKAWASLMSTHEASPRARSLPRQVRMPAPKGMYDEHGNSMSFHRSGLNSSTSSPKISTWRCRA